MALVNQTTKQKEEGVKVREREKKAGKEKKKKKSTPLHKNSLINK